MAKGKKTGGKVKGSLNKSTLEIKSIIDNSVDFKEVVEKLMELTNGVSVQQFGKDGIPRIYENPPDSTAAKILLEYRFGKPSQSVDITSGGSPLPISKTTVILPGGTSIEI